MANVHDDDTETLHFADESEYMDAAEDDNDPADPFAGIPNADDTERHQFDKPAPGADPERAAYTEGLRRLADLIDANPDLPLPYSGSSSPMLFMFLDHGEDNKAAMAAAARVIGGKWDKIGDDTYFDLSGSIAGVKVKLCAFRDEVCVKVVTGTREVTKMVKDPAALASVPEIEVIETVEDVEWRCAPLLADTAGSIGWTAARLA